MLGDGFLEDIRRIKATDNDLELQVHGSIRLARTLHEAGLVDVYRFLVAPVVVGDGSGIFGEDTPALTMNVQRSHVTGSGVLSIEMTPAPFRNSIAAGVEDGKDVMVET